MAARGDVHFAASRGDAKEVIRLLSQGADVNEQDYDRRTALHVAAANGHVNVLEALCARGADCNVLDRWERTPLADAVTGNYQDAVTFLRQRMNGVNKGTMMMKQVSFRQVDPNSPLSQLLSACAEGDLAKVKQMISGKTVNVNDSDDDRRTAAHLAASEGQLKVLEYLAEAGSNLNAKDRMGNRPLNDATRGQHKDCCKFLESKGGVLAIMTSSNSDQGRSLLEGGTAEVVEPKMMTLRHVSKDALNELHARGVREFWSWDQSDFTLEKESFAKGMGGEVFKCRFRNMECVAKTLGKLQSSKQNLTDLSNEISLMASIRHPNIVTFFGACFQLDEPVMLLEYCSGGNLESRIIRAYTQDTSRRIKMTDSQKLKYAHQMALAMTFLHKFHIPIIHRDLKPGNVLLTLNDDIKISDFGLAKFTPREQAKSGEAYKMTGETGSYRFMAPEVFEHRPYDQSVDVYAYSMILYWLYSGVRPFSECKDGGDAVRLACKRARPELKTIKEEQIVALCEIGWNHDPSTRPSFAEIADTLEDCKITGFTRARGRSRMGSRSNSMGGAKQQIPSLAASGSKGSSDTTAASAEEKDETASDSKPLQKRKSMFAGLFSN